MLVCFAVDRSRVADGKVHLLNTLHCRPLNVSGARLIKRVAHLVNCEVIRSR